MRVNLLNQRLWTTIGRYLDEKVRLERCFDVDRLAILRASEDVNDVRRVCILAVPCNGLETHHTFLGFLSFKSKGTPCVPLLPVRLGGRG